MTRRGALVVGAVLLFGVLVGWGSAQLADRIRQPDEISWRVDAAPGPLGPWRYALLSLRDAVTLCGAQAVHPARIDQLERACEEVVYPLGEYQVWFGATMYQFLFRSGSMELSPGRERGRVPVRIELPTDPKVTLDFEIRREVPASGARENRRDEPASVVQVGCRVGDAQVDGECPVDLLDGWDGEWGWTPPPLDDIVVMTGGWTFGPGTGWIR